MKKSIFPGIALLFLIFTCMTAPCASAEDLPAMIRDSAQPAGAVQGPALASSLTEEETIIIQSNLKKPEIMPRDRTYFFETGGSLPIYDTDFREFVDHGASITVGMRQRFNFIPGLTLTRDLFISPSIGLVILNGSWSMDGSRDNIYINSETWYPGYDDGTVTPETINDENLGEGNIINAEATVLNQEQILHLDLKTSLYIIPISLNFMMRPHAADNKISPYFGGGIGFCIAKRDVESRTLKEKIYENNTYRLTFSDKQTVTGQFLQLFAGIEIPVFKSMKFVAESSTALYGLKNFDPIVKIESKGLPSPYFQGDDVINSVPEDPLEIGKFNEEFVTSLSLGLVIPF